MTSSTRIRPFTDLTSLARAPAMTAAAIVLAALILLPLVWLFASGFTGAGGAGDVFSSTEFRGYALNSLALGLGTGLLAGAIGLACAWLVTMCEFPMRRVLEWALVLPLAAPAYIIAYVYADFLQHAGPVQGLLRAAFDLGPRDYWFPQIRSVPGAILVFSFVLYPYAYLLVRATLIEQSVCVLEASRSLGRTPAETFWRVALPLARPAILAGAALAAMEALADFGAVRHFGVPTFTTAIYQAYAVLGDRPLAVRFALSLLGLVAVLFLAERLARGRGQTRLTTGYVRPLPRYRLGPLSAAGALAACALPVIVGAALPLGLLIHQAVLYGHSALSPAYLRLAANTVTLGGLAALAAVACAVVLAYAARLSGTRLVAALTGASALGYAVPGSIIAIGVLLPLAAMDRSLIASIEAMFGPRVGLLLTGSVFALVYAYVVRFLMVALQPVEASLARVTPAMEGAARTLGAGTGRALLAVHLPLMRPGLLTGALIVFVEVVKELPATLILRPFNFDTLAIQAYRLASDERLAEASTASLAIFAVGLVSVYFLTRTIAGARLSERRGSERLPASARLT